jgi:hypothetical protein
MEPVLTAEAPARGRLSTELELHLYLTRGMARRHGVNLSEALHQGFLTRADFAAMIDRCQACPGSPADCRDFQEDHQSATAAPAWCANAPVLEGLRDLV